MMGRKHIAPWELRGGAGGELGGGAEGRAGLEGLQRGRRGAAGLGWFAAEAGWERRAGEVRAVSDLPPPSPPPCPRPTRSLEWVIDARQKGNTLRFANHSTTANCRAE